ncbi:hypothetical protein F5Y09DRAFT_311468 [Xylaria sp. FL1042]|nr:hypothetical protein F5Y09DRAFT_311468 [Xylaria sp. FL1042]
MNGGKLPTSSNKGTTNSEDERARLRRNQRNSRARKQAYIQDLEKRWNECVRLGAQATVEMQREARRVQEENGLLRTLLHKQGLDDTTIKEALAVLTASEGNKKQSTSFHCPTEYPAQTGITLAAPNAQNSSSCEWQSRPQGPLEPLSLGASATPLDAPADIYPELNVDDWLTDLCNIKDAFASDMFVTDQSFDCGNRLGTFQGLSPLLALNEAQPSQPLHQHDIELPQERDYANQDWQNMHHI